MVTAGPTHYEPPTYVFRIMFSDGDVQDVTAHQDDSRMRGWVLKHYAKEQIAAVVRLDEQQKLEV